MLRTRKGLLLGMLLAACDPGHGATDDDAADAADVAAPVEIAVVPDTGPAPDVWPDGYWLPSSMDDLYGLWVNDDGTTVRAFQLAQFDLFDADLAQVSPVYQLYEYPTGTSPVLFERGRATLAMGPLLHLSRVWSQTPTDAPTDSDLTLLAAPPKTFALATGSGTPRVYARAGKLP